MSLGDLAERPGKMLGAGTPELQSLFGSPGGACGIGVSVVGARVWGSLSGVLGELVVFVFLCWVRGSGGVFRES